MKLDSKFLFHYLLLFLLFSCDTPSIQEETMTDKKANRLINENSPYLQQHAYNPVDWYPWGDEAFAKAVEEDKLILVSVGYSACHWCHVMERESFEDDAVAAYMNDHFVCIKVDREERPDVDQIYMNAVQLMTQQGGWPLNCFTLNDGRPIYGGTYFPKDQWMNILRSLVDLKENEPAKVVEYAERLTEGIQMSELLPKVEIPEEFPLETLTKVVEEWKLAWDLELGGPKRAPKFPLPNNYSFLLHYASLTNDKATANFVELTLKQMAHGGIYDQIGGGFARYSVDPYWKVPHFEKMLYDNGQLISLYSEAWRFYKKEWMKDLVEQSIEFCDRELLDDSNCYYSALDADSEGEEGAFYVWKEDVLRLLLGDDYAFAAKYYSLEGFAHWENGNLIPLRERTNDEFFTEFNIAPEEGRKTIARINAALLKAREERERPGLDNKIITSWNGMMIKALCDAFKSFGKEEYLQKAERTAAAIQRRMRRNDGGLHRINPANAESINAYLDDYAFMIDAYISLYQCTFNENYLSEARQLSDYCLDHFSDDESSMFFYTSDLDKALIARKQEIMDNVIPASNSVMARNLFYLGKYFDRDHYLNRAKQMLANVTPNIDYGQSFSNWCILHLHFSAPYFELAVTGANAKMMKNELLEQFLPNVLPLGATNSSNLPLLEGKFLDTTTCFVCVNKSCKLPVHSTTEALHQIEEYH